MKKALIFQGQLVEVALAAFPVSPEMVWVDVGDDVTSETHEYDASSGSVIMLRAVLSPQVNSPMMMPISIL